MKARHTFLHFIAPLETGCSRSRSLSVSDSEQDSILPSHLASSEVKIETELRSASHKAPHTVAERISFPVDCIYYCITTTNHDDQQAAIV